MQLSSATVDFYILYDGPVDMQIRDLLKRSEFRVSDTQVIVRSFVELLLKHLN